jgi:hypothetical protein
VADKGFFHLAFGSGLRRQMVPLEVAFLTGFLTFYCLSKKSLELETYSSMAQKELPMIRVAKPGWRSFFSESMIG